ncbi:MAG: hypothetical protein Q9222_006071 [Ikaeria aurantiellina]
MTSLEARHQSVISHTNPSVGSERARRNRYPRSQHSTSRGNGNSTNTLSHSRTDHNSPSSHDPSLAFRPSSVAPTSQASLAGASSAEHSAADNSTSNGGRGGPNSRRRGAGHGRRGTTAGRGGAAASRRNDSAVQDQSVPVQQHPLNRQFGGRLTAQAENPDPQAPSSTLSASAAEFQPGQQHHKPRASRGRGGKKGPLTQYHAQPGHIHRRRDSSLKSTAPDIATRTHEDITNGLYECPICTSDISRTSKWSTNEGAARSAVESSTVVLTSVASNAIDQASVKMWERSANKPVASQRKPVTILNKIFITCPCQHLKQEIKCNASKSSEGNNNKTLSCDDECARLERNRKLALALNIDPEAHKDDHVPYTAETLRMFRESAQWAQEQEREFRVFAADEAEKRLRFKPMPSHQRSFLHALAEDFGLDSESMDPEPHRHVAVFKTPRFVMAPMKTLAECVRIRMNAEAAAASAIEEQRRLRSSNEAYNGYILLHPRFGLTIEELRTELSEQFRSTSGLAFDISFLPSEEIVIKARPATPLTNISPQSIQSAVQTIKPAVASNISSKRLASTCRLCSLDPSLNILRKETDASADIDGWSRVAAKAVAPRTLPRQTGVGEKSVYTVLGSKVKDAKRKNKEVQKLKAEETLVDDWEEEVRKEEEAAGEKANVIVGEGTVSEADQHVGEAPIEVVDGHAG